MSGILDRGLSKARQRVEAGLDLNGLREIHHSMRDEAIQWLKAGCSPIQVTEALSQWHDWIMQRVIRMAEEKEHGPLPRYCWLLLGSGGRREATFWTDQDHALVYEAVNSGSDERFARLAEEVARGLERAGYPLCEGNVMASNPRWRGTVEEWSKRIDAWVETPSLDHTRFLMILADGRPVYGAEELAFRLLRKMTTGIQQNPAALGKEAERAAHQPIPLGWFHHFYRERYGPYAGCINLKAGGYLQMLEAVRIWALHHGLDAASTKERVDQLVAKGHWEQGKGEEVLRAFDTFLQFRLRLHADQEKPAVTPHHYLNPTVLSRDENKQLTDAMRAARLLQKELQRNRNRWNKGDS
ncbi:hypothetical protein GCM10011571_12080 [Marinithermofilum abyssi]|uniref:CBS domain-containing protein n=1 Tax=Marinithermofilum abyssi TaxID=1571185 RepID=A0A8J2VI08_9BACL|nr:DUF294 nucleotidyltransferase-like domain-containing protein [Marinithermofilum abyssi]GGE12267.1 hypothetical protein GCM10011571_12080 [Marinithermofilum abyssi]